MRTALSRSTSAAARATTAPVRASLSQDSTTRSAATA